MPGIEMAAGAIQGDAANLINAPFQIAAAVKARRAMNAAMEWERRKQLGYQQQALGTFYGQLGATSPGQYGAALQAGAANRMAGYGALGGIPMQFGQPSQQSLSPARDAQLATLLGSTRARLGAYGDAALNTWLANQQAARDLNQVTSFAGGMGTILPYKMYQAQHAGDTLSAIGQALSSIVSGAQLGSDVYGNPSSPGGSPIRDGGVGTNLSIGTPTPAQWDALNAGYGPVTEQFAQNIPRNISGPGSLYTNPYSGQPYFTVY